MAKSVEEEAAKLVDAREQLDRVISEFIDAMKAAKLITPGSVRIGNHRLATGHELSWMKDGGKWNLVIDTSDPDHPVPCKPLMACDQALKLKAIASFESLIRKINSSQGDEIKSLTTGIEQVSKARGLLA